MLALAFAVLIGTHAIQMWMVYLLALGLGFVNVFDNPARQSLIPKLVPRPLVPNAVTLNSVTVNVARIFGAALGGTIASVLGLALCFGLNAVSFAAVLLTLALMSTRCRRDRRDPWDCRDPWDPWDRWGRRGPALRRDLGPWPAPRAGNDDEDQEEGWP